MIDDLWYKNGFIYCLSVATFMHSIFAVLCGASTSCMASVSTSSG